MMYDLLKLAGEIVGLIGVLLLLLGYALLQFNKITAKGLSYSMFNFWGALGILISLFFEWNLPAFVIEAAWCLLSLWGIVKAVRHKHHLRL